MNAREARAVNTLLGHVGGLSPERDDVIGAALLLAAGAYRALGAGLDGSAAAVVAEQALAAEAPSTPSLEDALVSAENLVLDRCDLARQGAEQRLGIPAGDVAVVRDEAYGALLHAWADWQSATHDLREAFRRSAAAAAGDPR